MECTMKYTLRCTCGEKIEADFFDQAKQDALGHIDGETSAHVVTCTRPAHGNPESIPVIVFIANPEKRPPIMQYTSEIETYRLGRR